MFYLILVVFFVLLVLLVVAHSKMESELKRIQDMLRSSQEEAVRYRKNYENLANQIRAKFESQKHTDIFFQDQKALVREEKEIRANIGSESHDLRFLPKAKEETKALTLLTVFGEEFLFRETEDVVREYFAPFMRDWGGETKRVEKISSGMMPRKLIEVKEALSNLVTKYM